MIGGMGVLDGRDAVAPNAVVEDADPPWWGRVFCDDPVIARNQPLSDRIAIEAHRQEIRSRCYAAAMARVWTVPREHFWRVTLGFTLSSGS